MKLIKKIGVVIVIAFFITVPYLSKAQPQDADVPADDTPFDGGVSILVASGIGYGILKGKMRKSSDNR
jgi:hypothetical protein